MLVSVHIVEKIMNKEYLGRYDVYFKINQGVKVGETYFGGFIFNKNIRILVLENKLLRYLK